VVEADTPCNLLDVGAHELADVRDLVDEADPRHQERVGGELDHLGRGHIGTDDWRVERRMQLFHRSPSAWSKAPITIRSAT